MTRKPKRVTEFAKDLADACEPERGAMCGLVSDPMPGYRQIYLWRYYVEPAKLMMKMGYDKRKGVK